MMRLLLVLAARLVGRCSDRNAGSARQAGRL